MRFTLTFDGLLPSAGKANSRLGEKWNIRNQLHPQLAELWQKHPILYRVRTTPVLAAGQGGIKMPVTGWHAVRYEGPDPGPVQSPFLDLCAPVTVGQTKFTPLVRRSLDLACSLKILFLRKQEPGSLINAGDIDNRLKVLFDGLRIPSPDEMHAGSPIADPLFCLLEQDSLINDCDIRTDRLLSRPNSNDNDVKLIIEATVKVMRVQPYNMAILGD